MRGRVFRREFKLEVCRQLVSGEKRPAQVCREHQLAQTVLLGWRKEYAERGEAAFSLHEADGPTSLEQRVEELERCCRQLALENARHQKGAADQPVAERHRMIHQAVLEAPSRSVRQLGTRFGASCSWYYGWPSPAERAARDVALRDAIEALLLEFPGYGYRRVTHALARAGWGVNHKRVLRVMRTEAPLSHLKRRCVPAVTTDARHGCPTYPHLSPPARHARIDRA